MLEALLEKTQAEVAPAPCGKDPADHPLYEAISDQRNRGGPFSGSADWKKAESLCLEFLGEVAKELGVMNTLVVALTHNHGLIGFNAGVKAQIEFCGAYWKDMYPEVTDKKRRIKAMRWLNDRIKSMVRSEQLTCDDRDLLEKTEKTIQALHEALLGLEAGKAIPSFTDLKEWIKIRLVKLPKAAAKPEPAAAAPVAAAPTAAAQPAPASATTPTAAPVSASPQPIAVTQAAADDASVDEQLKVLAKIASNIHSQAPNMAIAYKLVRMANWANPKLPPHDGNGETRIPAPNEQVINSLKTMAQRQAWVDLLHRCEDLTQRSPLWLELQYYGSMAAGSLGSAYDEIRQVIETETGALFEKMPKLAELKFNDGTPLATSAAVAWLEGLNRASGGEGGQVDPAAELRADLLKLGEAKFAEALSLAQTAVDNASSPLAALKLQLEAAAFALNANQAAMALSMLQGLASQVRKANLDQWEPKWSARVWAETVKACRVVGHKSNDALEHEALSALASLDLSLLAQLKAEDGRTS